MIDLTLEAFKYIQIPALIISVFVMSGMFYLMRQKDKMIAIMYADNIASIKEGVAALTKLTTLIDLLVTGRAKK